MRVAYQSLQIERKAGGLDRALPPSCITEPPRIHLPHISHSNYTHNKVLHHVKVQEKVLVRRVIQSNEVCRYRGLVVLTRLYSSTEAHSSFTR
jgi:hypothetical protein